MAELSKTSESINIKSFCLVRILRKRRRVPWCRTAFWKEWLCCITDDWTINVTSQRFSIGLAPGLSYPNTSTGIHSFIANLFLLIKRIKARNWTNAFNEPLFLKNYTNKVRSITVFYKITKAATPEAKILRSLCPRFYGVVESSEPNAAHSAFIRLEDLTRPFRDPCICDIKMGRVTYDPDATEEKKRKESVKYPPLVNTGFQLLGCRVSKNLLSRIIYYWRCLDLQWFRVNGSKAWQEVGTIVGWRSTRQHRPRQVSLFGGSLRAQHFNNQGDPGTPVANSWFLRRPDELSLLRLLLVNIIRRVLSSRAWKSGKSKAKSRQD